jgi:hypothetical protein
MISALPAGLFAGLKLRQDVSFGTLWWIREALWRKGHGEAYREAAQKRSAHPGVSILPYSPHAVSGIGMVPVLQGTSQRHSRAVEVRGLSKSRQDTTYFGRVLRPVRFAYSIFTDPSSEDPSFSQMSPLRFHAITRNHPKDRVDPTEEAALRKFVREKGLS